MSWVCNCHICNGDEDIPYPCDCGLNREYCSQDDSCNFLLVEEPYAQEEEAKTKVQDAIPEADVDSATLPLWDLWEAD